MQLVIFYLHLMLHTYIKDSIWWVLCKIFWVFFFDLNVAYPLSANYQECALRLKLHSCDEQMKRVGGAGFVAMHPPLRLWHVCRRAEHVSRHLVYGSPITMDRCFTNHLVQEQGAIGLRDSKLKFHNLTNDTYDSSILFKISFSRFISRRNHRRTTPI
jgi:hypothetical protein